MAELSEKERNELHRQSKLLQQRRFYYKTILGMIEFIMIFWGIILCLAVFPGITDKTDYSITAYIGMTCVITIIIIGVSSMLMTACYEWYDDF
jgi:hypothetical protein